MFIARHHIKRIAYEMNELEFKIFQPLLDNIIVEFIEWRLFARYFLAHTFRVTHQRSYKHISMFPRIEIREIHIPPPLDPSICRQYFPDTLSFCISMKKLKLSYRYGYFRVRADDSKSKSGPTSRHSTY
ncbi:MAG: hypothetical protein AMJ93_00710 [Anaerolineae bacterium SM23_84]|nr:MAG: hypothetical protein AMJ93_00710 [Anaerolineae bacterium SM23_84]